jgi:DNA polymerase I-like protein with 3'-5' exonuclease and polymerase domains
MILQVHDELVFDIPMVEKEIFEKLVREVMENVMNNYQLRITNTEQEKQVPPITVDISTGANWAEAK